MLGKAPSTSRRMAAMATAAAAGAAAVGLLAAMGAAAAQTKAPAVVAVRSSAGGPARPQPRPQTTTPTFTEVSGHPNPVRAGHSFTVTAIECDRVADVQATGTMKFVDLTKKKKLGTVPLSPSPKFVNCGQAKVIDHQKLRPGRYKIRATYVPGGRIPIQASAPATYKERVRRRK
jgi:hypothetical protein